MCSNSDRYCGRKVVPKLFLLVFIFFLTGLPPYDPLGGAIQISGMILQQVPPPISHNSADGAPPSLVVHGARDKYTAVPPEYRHHAKILGKGDAAVGRAFRFHHWKTSFRADHVQIYYRSSNEAKAAFFDQGQAWQRYSRVPGVYAMNNKDTFLETFSNYKEAHPEFRDYFLPQTFRLKEESDRHAFSLHLAQGGMGRPWVLKVANEDNGAGIEMIGPNSPELKLVVERVQRDSSKDYVIQEYICNELTWFDGAKFDLRFYWLIASVDPPIALFHNGFARVAANVYNETDFSSSRQHLTNRNFRTKDESESSEEYLWKRIREHYEWNRNELVEKIGKDTDPVQHVRNQMKEAIAATMTVFNGFRDVPDNIAMENLFHLLGADFIIDNDLNVWYTESQQAPAIDEAWDHMVEMYRDVFRPMVSIVDEIQAKQEDYPKANLLPLENIGRYELIYAGDWQYVYKDYAGRAPHDDKSECQGSTAH